MENGDGDGDGDAFPFLDLPCPVLSFSVLVANCTHEHVEKLIHNTLRKSVTAFGRSVGRSISQSIRPSRRRDAVAHCVGFPVIFLLPLPSHLTQPSRKPAEPPSWRNITARSITYRRSLRKLHTAASGPHTTWCFLSRNHSINYSLHYRCISAE